MKDDWADGESLGSIVISCVFTLDSFMASSKLQVYCRRRGPAGGLAEV